MHRHSLTLFLLFVGFNAFAQGINIAWTGAYDQNWLDSRNWSPQKVPTHEDYVSFHGSPVFTLGIGGVGDGIDVGFAEGQEGQMFAAKCKDIIVETGVTVNFGAIINIGGRTGSVLIKGALKAGTILVYTGVAEKTGLIATTGSTIRTPLLDCKNEGKATIYGQLLGYEEGPFSQTLLNVTNAIGLGEVIVGDGYIEGSLVVKYGGKINVYNSILNLKNQSTLYVDESATFDNNNFDITIPIQNVSQPSQLPIVLENQTLNGNINSDDISDLLTVNIIAQGGYQYDKQVTINGNITLKGGQFEYDNLNITGDFSYTNIPSASINLQGTLSINEISIFNYLGKVHYYGINQDGTPDFINPMEGRSKLTFSGSGNSAINFPTAFAVDSLVIDKSNCGKVFCQNNSLFVFGNIDIKSGQIMLNANPGVAYKLVTVHDLRIRNGGGLLLNDDNFGNGSSIAIGGSFFDENATVDINCQGFSNPYNGTVAFYSNDYSSSTRNISTASGISIGNIQFISQNDDPFTLTGNVTADNFDLGPHGKVILGDNDFTVNGVISNFDNNRFFVTNGIGKLQLKNIGILTLVVFPVGANVSSYSPVTITNNGTNDQFNVRVKGEVLAGGISGTPLTESVVNRTFFVEENVPGGSDVDMMVQWDEIDELPGFLRSNVFLAHFITNKWDYGTQGTAMGSGPYSFKRNNINSFSPFIVTNIDAALPVNWLSFKATPKSHVVSLTWQTASEQNASHFNVMRSTDGITFSFIGKVKAAGNSAGTNNYFFTDAEALNQGFTKLYYRLQQTDLDGKFEYSKTVSVNIVLNDLFAISPNPAGNFINLTYQSRLSAGASLFVEVTDMAGRKVLGQKMASGVSVTRINISSLLKGVYTITVINEGERVTKQFIKQ